MRAAKWAWRCVHTRVAPESRHSRTSPAAGTVRYEAMTLGIDVKLLGPLEVAVPEGQSRVRRRQAAAPLRRAGAAGAGGRLGRRARRGGLGPTCRPTVATRRCRSRSRVCARAWANVSRCAGVPPATRSRSSATRSTAAASRRCSTGARDDHDPGRLIDALALWRGPALADHRFDEFAQSEIERLEELRVEAIEERLAAELGPRPGRRSGRRAARARGRAPAPGAAARAADARALPRRPPGGRARGHARRRGASWSTSSGSSRARSCASSRR